MKLLFATLFLLIPCCFTYILPTRIDTDSQIKRLGRERTLNTIRDIVNRPENRKTSCLTCTIFVDGLQALIRQNATDNDIVEFGIWICETLNLDQPYVCKKLWAEYMDELVFVLTRTLFTPDEICGAFVADCGHSENPLNVMWNLTIPGNKPPVKPWPTIPDGKPTYKVLHLSDIHIDRKYAVGSEAYCQMDSTLGTYALCCREYPDEDSYSERRKPIYVPAGPWGMPYKCDLPYQTFEATLKHINVTHTDLDYIIITGDFEAHDGFEYERDLTISNIQNITATLLKYFPSIPIYVTIGNHEGVPQDQLAPHTMPQYEERGPQWIYSTLKDMFAHWIPTSALPDVQ